MRDRSGVTPVELMIAVVIIVILAGISVALLVAFVRGQGVRQGARQDAANLESCRTYSKAARPRMHHHVRAEASLGTLTMSCQNP